MVGSTDGMGASEKRMRHVTGAGGNYIGMLPVALSRDMDPASRIIYLIAGKKEYVAIATGNQKCRLLDPKATEEVRRFAYRES